jgi:polysaccharide pyruvyl transferase WcaK-like protein
LSAARIGLVGYFGHGNYGDELFLDIYRKYFHDCELVVLRNVANNPTYPGINMDEIDRLDAIIIGGGDLFIPKYFAETYFDERLLQKPIYFHGTGVPLWIGKDEAVVARMAQFVQHANIRSINVRDAESAAWINRHLKPRFGADFSPDMVFAMNLPGVRRDPGKKVFGLIMRHLRVDESNWSNIIKLLDRAKGFGYEIRNIVLGTGKTRDDDLITLRDFDYPGIVNVDPNDLRSLTVAIGECDVIASTKFHGCVVATAYGIPSITLSTTDKFVNLMRMIDRRDLIGHYVHDDLPERLPKYIAPIPALTRRALRNEASAAMMRLRRFVLNEQE